MTATAAATSPACPRCGRALPADAPAGLCPRCLLSDGFGGQSEADYRVRTGDGRRFVPPTIEELAGEFPNLEFVRPLGSGGMGAVYLAKQIRLDRPIAVKVLPPDLADDGAFAERFLREARALARLSHPNIVSVFDFGQSPGGLYFFLMEYIEGPTLRQVVASRSTDPKQALEIVRQVCDALQYAHDKGVVHRDIKPENILLDGHGRVKIADFGLAKLLGLADAPAGSPAAGSLTHTQQAMGTPHYMAPEQIVGSRGVDHRADIYSLGVVFYELLTGELPLGRFAPPSKKVQVDVRLDEVVLRSLEAEPAQRYQRASEVRTAVDSIESVSPRGPATAAAMRFVREASAGVGSVARTVLQPAGPGELSRKAAFGLMWWAAVPLALLFWMLYEAFDGGLDLPATLFATMGSVLALPAFTAPVGGTILGLLAVREVRGAGGRIVGLVPGLAAALALPVLFVVGVCCGTAFAVPAALAEDPGPGVAGLLFVGLPLTFWVLGLTIRAAWRKAIEGVPAELVEREFMVVPAPLRAVGGAIGQGFVLCGELWEHLFGGVARESRPDGIQAVAGATPGAAPRVVAAAAGPRFSRKAVIGAVWALAVPVAGLLLMVIVSAGGREDVRWVVMPWLMLAALPAVTALFGTTILGWTAVGDVRRSGGRMTGLGLAVFDGLLFPLVVLDLLLAAAMAGVTAAVAATLGLSPHQTRESVVLLVPLTGVLATVGVWAVVDTLIVRAVWRRVTADAPAAEGLAAPRAVEAAAREWAGPVRLSGKALIGVAWAGTFLVGGLLLLALASIHDGEPVRAIVLMLLGLVALPAVTAPIGATALGWTAVVEIRRSGGRLFGLPLAVFDGLVFPLLVLDAAIGAAVAGLTMAVIVLSDLRPATDEFAMTSIGFGGFLAGLAICAVADLWIARRVWRRVTRDERREGGEERAAEPRRGYRDLYVGLGVIAVAVVLFALKVAREEASHVAVATRTPAASSTQTPGTGPVPPAVDVSGMSNMGGMTSESEASPLFDSSVRWYSGPNGAQLGEAWATFALGLDDARREQVDAVLRDVHAEYERVLDAHTTVTFQGRTVVFRVESFQDDYDRLADEFWTRVDALLSREQQAVMRYNFPLKYDPADNVVQERYEDKLLPLGHTANGYGTATEVRIGRSGQWYDWNVTLPDMGTGGETPELPLWLRHWQERYDVLDSLRRSGANIDPKRPPLIARKPRRAEAMPAGMGMMMEGGVIDGGMGMMPGGMGAMADGAYGSGGAGSMEGMIGVPGEGSR